NLIPQAETYGISCCSSSSIAGLIHRQRVRSTSNQLLNADTPSLSEQYSSKVNRKQKQLIEHFVYEKLEEYTRRARPWRITNIKHIEKRLLRQAPFLAKQNYVPESLVCNWIHETLARIDTVVQQLKTLVSSQNDLIGTLISKTKVSLDEQSKTNKWYKLQLKRAKEISKNEKNLDDNELLYEYQQHVINKLTPNKTFASSSCFRHKTLNLDAAYDGAERTGKEYLSIFLTKYAQRPKPNIQLLDEIVSHGMKQMQKPPRLEELKAVNNQNVLTKAAFIYKTKRAYEMNLKNQADDFMLLRFGKILTVKSKSDDIGETFMQLIHMFLSSVQLLANSMKNDEHILIAEHTISSYLSPTKNDISDKVLLLPETHIDQWTWLLEKWKEALQTFPFYLTKSGAFGRLLRTTIGVGIARLYGFAENKENINDDQIDEKFFEALQVGYYYGVAYAFVDGLQDDREEENSVKQQSSSSFTEADINKWLLTMENVLCGQEFDRDSLPKLPVTKIVFETFDSLIELTERNHIKNEIFNDLALLLRSQRSDIKELDKFYFDLELYMGTVMKSHFTYTATALMGKAQLVESSERSWEMPVLGQMTDDFRDFFDDLKSRSVTSFTHYYHHKQHCLEHKSLNPFYIFLYMCEDLYLNSGKETQTGAFLGRRIIRTLRALELNSSKLGEFLEIFAHQYPELESYCWSLRTKFDLVSDPEKSFFRSINDYGINYAHKSSKGDRTHRKLETYVNDHLKLIENNLKIKSESDEHLLTDGINYAVSAGGKRLRPLLLFMIADLYNLSLDSVLPLATALEYLHTSSLILDDLPAQDNSDTRRGQATLHTFVDEYIPASLSEGRAQLVAVDLIAHAMQLVNQGLLQNGYSVALISNVNNEISKSMHELCVGQMLDLVAARCTINQENNTDENVKLLDKIAWLKTGKAIEVVLVCPVILAGVTDTHEISQIREFGRLLGILFQMKDDLLDIEGEATGKPKQIDERNQTVTYISVLGQNATRERLKTIERQAKNLVEKLWPSAGTVQNVIRYIVERKN
ncbi:unnamed protein product, partial [Didymodactylos carnosus]